MNSHVNISLHIHQFDIVLLYNGHRKNILACHCERHKKRSVDESKMLNKAVSFSRLAGHAPNWDRLTIFFGSPINQRTVLLSSFLVVRSE